MLKSAFRPEKIHGLLFDGATFLGNIAFFGYLPTLGDEVNSTAVGALLLLAVVAQMAGAWGKKGFLPRRLAQRTRRPASGFARGFMNLLLFFHFLLFTLTTLLGLAELGIYDFGDSGSFSRGDIWVAIALVIGALTTFLVNSAEKYNPADNTPKIGARWLEFGADGLLWVSVIILTRVFWDSLVGLIEQSSGIGVNAAIMLLVAMSILYMVFYLPSRYLFLVEDYHHGLTWFQVWAAMLPVVWLVIVR